MRLVDVEPFIKAWKQSGNGKKDEAKALMNSGIYSEYNKGVALDAAADLVLALAKQLENYPSISWTSVKDKLPEYGEYVLVFTEGCSAIGHLGEDRFGKNKWKSDSIDEWGDVEILEDVTHWMPLPDEPKDNA